MDSSNDSRPADQQHGQQNGSTLKRNWTLYNSQTLSSPTLNCGICGEFYRLPRILPCLHSFCSECIANLRTYPSNGEDASSNDTDHTAEWLVSEKPLQSSEDVFGVSNGVNGDNCRTQTACYGSDASLAMNTSSLPRGRSRHAKLIEKRLKMKRSRSCTAGEEGFGNGSSEMDISESNLSFSTGSVVRSSSSLGGFKQKELSVFDPNGVSNSSLFISSNSKIGKDGREKDSLSEKRRVVLCPTCLREINLTSSLDELPRNFMLERLVANESFSKSLNSAELRCDSCCDDVIDDTKDGEHGDVSESPKFATVRCTDCQENLCSLCEFAHRRQKKTKAHRLVTYDNFQKELFVSSSSDSLLTIPENTGINNDQGGTGTDQAPKVGQNNGSSKFLKKVTKLKLPNLHKFGRLLQKEVKDSVASSGTVTEDGKVNETTMMINGDRSTECGETLGITAIKSSERNSKSLQGLSLPMMCLKHPKEELRIFCLTCEESICRDCAALEHRDHRCQMVTKELFKNQMEDIDNLIREVTPKMEEVESHLDTLEGLKVKVTERSQDIKAEINAFMDLYVDAIQRHRDHLLSQVTTLAEDKKQSLDVHQHHLQQVKCDLEHTCRFVAQLLVSGSDLEILSLKHLVTSRLQGHLYNVTDQPQTKLNGFLRFCPTEKGDVINHFQMFGRVVAREPCAGKSVISGEGLITARIGHQCSLTLTVCDADDVTYTGNDVTVRVWIVAQDQQLKHTQVGVVQLRDGTHRITFTPSGRGDHFLHVTVNGQPIQDSPFKFKTKGRWRRHEGVWHCCSLCSGEGRRNVPCQCGSLMPGGFHGCGHDLPGYPGGPHWSCCGKMSQDSECGSCYNSIRTFPRQRTSPVKEITL